MNSLKTILTALAGRSECLTAQDYRVHAGLRVHAGKMLLYTTPLVALGAVTNAPGLMIPAFYMPTALAIPAINYFLLKTVPQPGRSHFFAMKKLLFSPLVGIILLIFGGAIYEGLFSHPSFYQKHHGFAWAEHQFQQHYGWTLIVAGLLMTGVCVWLSFTLIKGRRTQSMQRIALHLAAQEAENA